MYQVLDTVSRLDTLLNLSVPVLKKVLQESHRSFIHWSPSEAMSIQKLPSNQWNSKLTKLWAKITLVSQGASYRRQESIRRNNRDMTNKMAAGIIKWRSEEREKRLSGCLCDPSRLCQSNAVWVLLEWSNEPLGLSYINSSAGCSISAQSCNPNEVRKVTYERKQKFSK